MSASQRHKIVGKLFDQNGDSWNCHQLRRRRRLGRLHGARAGPGRLPISTTDACVAEHGFHERMHDGGQCYFFMAKICQNLHFTVSKLAAVVNRLSEHWFSIIQWLLPPWVKIFIRWGVLNVYTPRGQRSGQSLPQDQSPLRADFKLIFVPTGKKRYMPKGNFFKLT
jgi:hypothetical protein